MWKRINKWMARPAFEAQVSYGEVFLFILFYQIIDSLFDFVTQ